MPDIEAVIYTHKLSQKWFFDVVGTTQAYNVKN